MSSPFILFYLFEQPSDGYECSQTIQLLILFTICVMLMEYLLVVLTENTAVNE
jgi:hypothetical protein